MSTIGLYSRIPKPAYMAFELSGRRRHGRFRSSSMHLLIQLVLVCTLLVAEPLGARSWSAGGHVTPEQWARHVLLTGLGFLDHHGSDGARDIDGGLATADVRAIVGFANAPISGSGLVPSGLIAMPPVTGLISLLLVALSLIAVSSCPRGRSAPRPPHPPPKASIHSNGWSGLRAWCPLRP